MSDQAFDHKEFTASLPKRPGVYRMFDADGELSYVGKAKSLKDRVTTYFNPSNVAPKIQALVHQIAKIEVTVTNSEAEALLLEYNLIKAHQAALQHRPPRRQELSVRAPRGRARLSATGVLSRLAQCQGALFWPVPECRARCATA